MPQPRPALGTCQRAHARLARGGGDSPRMYPWYGSLHALRLPGRAGWATSSAPGGEGSRRGGGSRWWEVGLGFGEGQGGMIWAGGVKCLRRGLGR